MLDEATDLVSSWLEEGVIPGAALLVSHGGELVVERYWGLADRTRDVRASADTLWSIASITKPVTAAAMMACVDRGLLQLDQPLHEVLPEFARQDDDRPWRRDVTLRHLVTHTSGLAGFSRDNLDLRKRRAPIDDFIKSFLDEEVHFQPGRWHLYSSVGLGLVAESVGRKTWQGGPSMAAYESFTTGLLRDLGATDFVFRPDDAQQQRIAWVESTGQEGLEWEIGNSRYFRSLGFPWGGLYMRARDVLTFVEAFLPHRSGTGPLSSAATEAMIAQQVAPPEAPVDVAPAQRDVTWDPTQPPRQSVPWGLGWQVKGAAPNDFMGTRAHETAFGHYGASGSIAWADPRAGLAVVLLTNRAWQSWWPVQDGRAARLADSIIAGLD